MAAGFLVPPAVHAVTDLDKEMAELAKQVHGVVKERGNAIQVGDFVAKGNAARQAATGGTAIAKALVDALGKRGVQVSRTADLLVSGEYRDVTDKDSKTTALQIKARIEDRNGEPVIDLDSRGLFSLTTIASLVGITTVTPPSTTPEKAEKTARRRPRQDPVAAARGDQGSPPFRMARRCRIRSRFSSDPTPARPNPI